MDAVRLTVLYLIVYRIDMQYHMIFEILLEGRKYLSTIKNPKKILDQCTGTGTLFRSFFSYIFNTDYIYWNRNVGD
jgi:hypothetical protein